MQRRAGAGGQGGGTGTDPAPADRGGEGLLPRRGHQRSLGSLVDPGRPGSISPPTGAAGWSPPPTGCGSWCRSGPCTRGRRRSTSGSASGPRRDLAEHRLGQGDGARRPAGARHDAGLPVHPGRHPPPGRHRASGDHHDRPGQLQRHRVRHVRDLRLPVRAPPRRYHRHPAVVDRHRDAGGRAHHERQGQSTGGAPSTAHLRRVSLPAIVQYWDDMLRVAGSLATARSALTA